MENTELPNNLIKVSLESKTRVVDPRPRRLFSRTLTYDCRGKDVQLLHELLNKDNQTLLDPQRRRPTDYVQNFFGSNTERAVKRFQKKYELYSSGDDKFGIVETETIKKLRSLFGNGSFYLQERRRLGITSVQNETEIDLQNISLGMGDFIDRAVRIFLTIFRYWFKGKPIFSTREYAFGNYLSLSFPRAKRSPLLQLFKENNIAQYKGVEILIKNTPNHEITDIDLDSILAGIKDINDTLYIIVSSSEAKVRSEELYRVFRAFQHDQILVLPLTAFDLDRFENWIIKGNINACLISFLMLANRILVEGEPHWWREDPAREFEVRYLEEKLDRMADAITGQLRTLIKKLVLITKFSEARGGINEACRLSKISRRTYYVWCNNDPAFRNIFKSNMP